MPDAEALYLKLPIPLQQAACSMEGWGIQRTRFGKEFACMLDDVERRTFWSPERIRSYRDQRLRAFVRHCVESVPFYRGWFHECGMCPADVRSIEDLQHLPVLTKRIVQDHCPQLFSERITGKHRIITHTSGTTGGGLRFGTTRAAIREQWAIWWRYRRWHGLQPGTWCGYLGGRSVVPLSQSRPPFWRYNVPGKQILFSAYHMSSATLGMYVDELRHRQPPWLHGYPSLLAIVAAYIIERDIELGYGIRWITTGAENLLLQQANLIERAFGVRPKQHYGMAEAVANISECEHGTLHVDEDFAAVEFVSNREGQGFRVLGTNFTNYSTPLLRYDAEDLVTPTDIACPCGRPGRTVAAVDGRKEDYVVLKSGAHLGRLDHIFKDMVNIREAQIVQKCSHEIIVRVVRGDKYLESDEAALHTEIRKRLGGDTRYRLEYVQRLERSASGKLRFVVSEIQAGRLETAA